MNTPTTSPPPPAGAPLVALWRWLRAESPDAPTRTILEQAARVRLLRQITDALAAQIALEQATARVLLRLVVLEARPYVTPARTHVPPFVWLAAERWRDACEKLARATMRANASPNDPDRETNARTWHLRCVALASDAYEAALRWRTETAPRPPVHEEPADDGFTE